MLQQLDLKIRQMHEALGKLRDPNLSSIAAKRFTEASVDYCHIDFNQGTSEVELANIASLLVANIARMKDHLKLWCAENGKNFNCENLVDSDRDVALVHDLWNIDKHGKLKRLPRSKCHPKIQNLRKSLSLSTGDRAGGAAMFSIDMRTGKIKTTMQNGGSVNLVLSGDVMDENGVRLGDFAEICERATAAWEQALRDAGVPLPAR